MCGRFVRTTDPADLAAHLCATIPDGVELPPSHNVAPGTDVWTLFTIDGERVLRPRHWGLVPPWAKDPAIGNRMINARSETLAEKRSFAPAFRRRRCLLPVDGFYEWATVPGSRRKQPYLIRHPDGVPYLFAGLWERWSAPGRDRAGALESTTIITTSSNEPMSPIHHRMPVIIDPDDLDLWLDPEVDDPAVLSPLLEPATPDVISMHPVSLDVGNVRNDRPELIERVDPIRPDEPGEPTGSLF